MPKPEVGQTEATKAAEVAAPKDCNLVKNYDWDHSIAYAICMAESRGNHLAHNYSDATKDNSYGLFQINLYGGLAKNRPSPEVLKDPVKNVEYAYSMYKSQSWNPWSAYNNGQYKKYRR